MSENGCGLVEIVDFVENTVRNMGKLIRLIDVEFSKHLDHLLYILSTGTISVSLSSCAVPGSSATFHIDDDRIELGLGG